MSIKGSIVTKDLRLSVDMDNPRSNVGKPTTNHCWAVNPKSTDRLGDASFQSYTSDTTFNANHPGRVLINAAGGGTTGTLVNTGVNGGNWQVTHHAYWTWDEQLNQYVCIQNDVDGQWKAWSFGTGLDFTALGWSAGDTYSISWDGWTTRIDKSPNCGIYMRSSSGSWGFHAGQANSQDTAKNTKPYTWERLYATFTVPANMNMTQDVSMYNYGYYTGRGITKMANLQWEAGVASPLVIDSAGNAKSSRSSTEALIDLTGNNVLTVSNLVYSSPNSFEFNGSTSVVTMPNTTALNPTAQLAIEAWVEFDGNSYDFIFEKGNVNTQYSLFSAASDIVFRTKHSGDSGYHSLGSSKSDAGISNNVPVHIVGTWDGTTKRIYVNGELKSSASKSGALVTTTPGASIGRFGGTTTGYYFDGHIYKVRIHGANLTAAEVKQNFNADRKRFGL